MIHQYEIRSRIVEIATQSAREIRAESLLLPWPEGGSEHPAGALGLAGTAVLDEIAAYRGERDVMLTSAGALPARFLFLLSLPVDEPCPPSLIEERFRDCLFQASVLGLAEVAVPVLEFSPYVSSFSELVDSIWNACREFLGRERGPQRILFLVDNRDLRGQYLRHFLRRKESEDHDWDEEGAVAPRAGAAAPRELPPAAPPAPQGALEKVLSPELLDADFFARGVADLLADYGAGRDPAETLARLEPAMRTALLDCLGDGFEQTALPPRLRILGDGEILRLPWELLRRGDRFLGEDHLIARGISFLHFLRNGRIAAGRRPLRLLVRGEAEAARELGTELQQLARQHHITLDAGDRDAAGAGVVHCLGRDSLRELLAGVRMPCDLTLLELEPGDEPPSGGATLEDWAQQLLGRGCRRALIPLAPFRDEAERRLFRAVLYGRLFLGDTAGEALLRAQAALRREFGPGAGWFLFRLFGQTDEGLVPARRPGPAGELSGIR
ncbi:MAG: hypothetical protein JW819_03775 [Candidatus Krumholzibacteriota bacterium]|nr:hypothetical protein [Candidatus Krumholzibacteriota bacterium]